MCSLHIARFPLDTVAIRPTLIASGAGARTFGSVEEEFRSHGRSPQITEGGLDATLSE